MYGLCLERSKYAKAGSLRFSTAGFGQSWSDLWPTLMKFGVDVCSTTNGEARQSLQWHGSLYCTARQMPASLANFLAAWELSLSDASSSCCFVLIGRTLRMWDSHLWPMQSSVTWKRDPDQEQLHASTSDSVWKERDGAKCKGARTKFSTRLIHPLSPSPPPKKKKTPLPLKGILYHDFLRNS